MKILVYSHRIGSKTITFIHNEINQLSSGNEVLTVYHINENILKLNQCELHKIRHYHSRFFSSVLYYLEKCLSPLKIRVPIFSNQFRKIVEAFKPDIIHIHFGTIAERVLFKNEIQDIPVFISFHGYDASRALHNPIYVKGLRRLLQQDNMIPVFVSKHMKNYVESKLEIGPIEKSKILYYGTNTEFFKRRLKPDRAPVKFLQISSFVEKKGHIYTLEAFKLFIDNYTGSEEIKLILAGGGPLLEQCIQKAEELGIGPYIEFPGWVDLEQAHQLMEESHYFVHHSIVDSNGDKEGIPNAIMEAMSMELAVISTFHSGIPELVEDGKNGFLVEEKDIRSYAQKFKEILDMDFLAHNREKVVAQFEMKAHRDHLIGFYKEHL